MTTNYVNMHDPRKSDSHTNVYSTFSTPSEATISVVCFPFYKLIAVHFTQNANNYVHIHAHT